MKKLLLSLLIITALGHKSYGFNYQGSDSITKTPKINLTTCPKVYFGISGGVNNPGGVIAFAADVPIRQQFSLGAGIGFSSWGHKFYGEARAYLSPCHRGWALGVGLSHNTGVKSYIVYTNRGNSKPFSFNLGGTSSNNPQAVDLFLRPVTNVFFSAYKFWRLGHHGNRFYIQTGYSLRLTNNYYSYNNPQHAQLDQPAKDELRSFVPGGIIGAIGFSFGLGGH